MRLKFKKSVLGLTLLMLGLVLYSCIDEPFIEPVKRPYSSIKFVNLSVNEDNMKVTVDGTQPVASLNAMPLASSTEYFDVNSGKRNIKVFNEAGELIFDKNIDVTSFERIIVVFSGKYSPVDLENTFTHFEIAEGEIYVSSKPAQDSLNIYLVQASTNVDTSSTKTYQIDATYKPDNSDVTKDTTYSSSLAFGNVAGVGNAVPGTYQFSYITDTDTLYYPENEMTQLNANFRYYIYIYGNPDNPKFYKEEVVPPPIRARN